VKGNGGLGESVGEDVLLLILTDDEIKNII
jgi:hypothetical protein